VTGRTKRRKHAINLHLYHYAGNNPVRYTDPDGRQTAVPLPTGESLVGMTAEEMGACFDELLADCGPAAFFIFTGLFIFSLNGDSVATQRNQDTQKEEANEVSSSIKQSAQAAAPSPMPNKHDDDEEQKTTSTNQSAKDAKKISSNEEANKFAQDKGYEDAHALKENYVGKKNISKFDIYRNNTTGESFLINKEGTTIVPIE